MKHQEPTTDNAIKGRTRQITHLLESEYDTPEWQPNHTPISVLVQTILSQNTSDTNSGSAFQSLTASFGNWEDVVDADVYTIANIIKHGGLGMIKAQRIKQALKGISGERGRLELDFLNRLAPSDAEKWLLKLPGVGLKTARCVLLFALGIPALPVDTHILRVSKRLGLLDSKASLHEAHYVLAESVSPDDIYKFHVLIIEHGRRICRARRPYCQRCILNNKCPSRIL